MAKILVVDDDPDCVELLSIHLLKQGHRIVGAKDGPDALERASWEKPDAILLDLRLPAVDGIRVIEILRGNELTVRTPIILMSAADRDWAIRRLHQDELTRFLEKPLDFDKLDAVIRELIESAKTR